MAIARISLTACRTESGATRACVLGSMLAGIVNVLLSSAVVSARTGDNWIMQSMFPQVMWSWASGVIFGAPPGLVFGAVLVLPVRRVHGMCRVRAVEGADRALALCGLWLSIVAIGCFALGALAMPTVRSGLSARPFLLGCVLGVAALGAAAALVGSARMSRRRRWFERVQAGQVPGWTIVPRSFVADELADLRPLFVSSANHNVVLVQYEAVAAGGAYRAPAHLVPRALVHLPEGLAAMSFSLPSEDQQARWRDHATRTA
jgi:hypothetical protein